MNITDLRSELDRQADDLPNLEAIRADADRRLAGHARRRRRQALLAAAAAVLVVAGGASLVGATLSSRPARPAGPTPTTVSTPTPTVTVPSVLPTARTTLPTATDTVPVEPLPVELPFALSTDRYRSVLSLSVSPEGAVGQASLMVNDTLVLGGNLRWTAAGPTDIPADASAVTVGGHHARTWPEHTTLGWITHVAWTLPDGSGIEITGGAGYGPTPGNDKAGTLAFAGQFTDGSTPLPRVDAPTLGVGAFSQPEFAFVASTDPSRSTGSTADVIESGLCRPGTSITVSAPDSCAVDFGAAESLPASLEHDAGVATIRGQQVYVSADGRTVSRIDGPHTITTVWADGDGSGVTTADLAAILASIPGWSPSTTAPPALATAASGPAATTGVVGTTTPGAVAPTVTGTAPNSTGAGWPSSSLADTSAATSRSHAPAPTATTTLGTPSGSLVHNGSVRFPVPFTIIASTDHPAEVSWTIGPSTGLLTVDFPGWTYQVAGKEGMHGGAITYDRTGLHGVPSSAVAVTVAGHPARLWSDGNTRIGWTLPDGSSIVAAGDTEAVARLVVTMVDGHESQITVHAAPTLLPPSLKPARLEMASDPAAPMQPSGQRVLTLTLCPTGGVVGTGDDDPRCLSVLRDPRALTNGTFPDKYADWRAATIGKTTIYVSPAVHAAVATVTGDGILLSVTAASDARFTAADLAAILLSIPR